MKKTKKILCLVMFFSAVCSCLGIEKLDKKAISAQNPSQLARKIVLSALKNKNPRVRTSAIEVISAGKRIEFIGHIVKAMQDPVVNVRFAAALTSGDLNYLPAKEDIKKLLQDPDKNVAIAAAYAMVKLGQGEYFQQIQAAASDQNPTVAANAAMLLGQLGDKQALPTLYGIKDNHNLPDVATFNATEAIAKLGDQKIYSKIWTMLISAFADDRYMGIIAMAQLKTPQAANAIMTMLEDDILEVRLTAAEKLGLFGNKSGEDIVLEHLANIGSLETEKSSREPQDVIATLAIGTIGTEKLISYLPKQLNNESVLVRLAAAKSVFILEKQYR